MHHRKCGTWVVLKNTRENLSNSMSISHFRIFSYNVLISIFLVFINTSQVFELSGVRNSEREIERDRERWGIYEYMSMNA
jgi:hypothetical protein